MQLCNFGLQKSISTDNVTTALMQHTSRQTKYETIHYYGVSSLVCFYLKVFANECQLIIAFPSFLTLYVVLQTK